MLKYYKRSLLRLFSLVWVLRAKPSGESGLCLSIQEQLLKNIACVESKIRQCHASTKNLHACLGRHESTRLTKTEAQAIRNDISFLRHRIDEYRQLLSIFREIGDALAFTYIDKYDIKPLAVKEPPGFLSQKAGLRRELMVLRTVCSLGHIAIMNDLTNCLRYGDISVPKDHRLHVIEVKSGKPPRNSPRRRQFAEARKICDYLTRDEADDLYGVKGRFRRIEAHSPEVHHRDQLNALVSRAMRNGTSCEEVENGLYYLVSTRFRADAYDMWFSRCEGKPIVFVANETKHDRTGYYPFSLSIFDPEAWYAFHCDRLVICVLVDSAVIESEFKVHGMEVELLAGKDWVMSIADSGRGGRGTECAQVSRHFFGRLSAEFLSLGWLLQELVQLVKPGLTRAHGGEWGLEPPSDVARVERAWGKRNQPTKG